MSLVVKETESAPAAPVKEVTRRPSENFSAPKKRGGSKVLVRLITLVVVLGAGLGAIVAIAKMGDSAERVIVTSPVVKSDLVITVTEDGTLESAANVEMKCEVEGGSTILEIIPDGTMVTKGTRLALLDSSTIEENFNAQKNVVGKAEATKIASGNTLDATKIAVQEYLEGTYVQSLQTAESNIVIAQQNLAAAENIAKHSEKMLRKGYTTPLQHQSNVYSVQKAKLDLELQKTTKMVLEKFTKAKTLEDLESARDSAEAQYKSDLGTYELEAAKLKRLENNLKKCEIIAPQDGMVVYANDLSGGGRGGQQTPKIEQGAAIKQYQAVIRLPDLTKMQVKTLVHESKVEQLRSGQRARIKVQGREVQGSLTNVGSQPEAGNFFGGAGTKEYAAYVRVDGTAEGLKPGMTADVTVLIGEHKGVLAVPVQCVVAKGRKAFAWVKNGQTIEQRELVLGATNDTLIEVKDGLSEGDLVLQHPRADVPDARTDTNAEEKVDVEKAFGASKANISEASAPGGPGGPGGAPAGGPGMQGGPGNGPPGEGGPGGGRRGGGGGRRRMPSFKEMDKDSDGKVSKEEFPQEMIRMFDFVDANQDGFFDQEESKAAEERRKQMEQQGGFGGGGGFGGPGGPPQ